MPERKKTSMSVMEMGRMLGLKKTDSYYLMHKGWFETITVNGHFRVMVDSFEEWYQNQTHYKKVKQPEKKQKEMPSWLAEGLAALEAQKGDEE